MNAFDTVMTELYPETVIIARTLDVSPQAALLALSKVQEAITEQRGSSQRLSAEMIERQTGLTPRAVRAVLEAMKETRK